MTESPPPRPVRKRTRLEGYDYAQAGAYFVTVRVNNRQERLSRIVDDRVRYTPAGRMAFQ